MGPLAAASARGDESRECGPMHSRTMQAHRMTDAAGRPVQDILKKRKADLPP